MRREIGRSFFFEYTPARRSRLLTFEGPLRAGPRLIAAHVVAAVGRDDRVWLQGPNGAGKTTLLEALSASSTLPAGRLLHLPQEMEREEAGRVLAEVAAMSPDERGRILNLVAALGVVPDRLLVSGLPSPGEARKLVMATGMATGAWCLLLDEPTNHLDLPSIERLEEAVAGYPGAVVLVTHDEDFATATTTKTWQLEGGVLQPHG
jgi:ATPase subunit of ABC transporter with duplicated ATPase domains